MVKQVQQRVGLLDGALGMLSYGLFSVERQTVTGFQSTLQRSRNEFLHMQHGSPISRRMVSRNVDG